MRFSGIYNIRSEVNNTCPYLLLRRFCSQVGVLVGYYSYLFMTAH